LIADTELKIQNGIQMITNLNTKLKLNTKRNFH